MSSPTPSSILLATRNAHKVREIQQVLGNDFVHLTLLDFPGAPLAREDAPTFAGNAAKKAAALTEWIAANPAALPKKLSDSDGDLYVLADDSGLEVDALDGAPGVHSARFAALDHGGEGNSSDAENNAKLQRLLEPVPAARRTARFHCVLAARKLRVTSADGNVSIVSLSETFFFTGVCEGRISPTASGGGGFGYDPYFIPDGHAQSFAALGDAVKNSMSHRAQALEKLRQFLVKSSTR